jgi:hypothetical protein
MAPPPCPYVYPNGDKCPGHIVRVEAFNADLSWALDETGNWRFSHSQPRSQYLLFCSEKGNHAEDGRPEQMKCYTTGMPDDLLIVIASSAQQPETSLDPLNTE